MAFLCIVPSLPRLLKVNKIFMNYEATVWVTWNVSLSVCMSVYIYVYLTVYMSVCLCVCVYMCRGYDAFVCTLYRAAAWIVRYFPYGCKIYELPGGKMYGNNNMFYYMEVQKYRNNSHKTLP